MGMVLVKGDAAISGNHGGCNDSRAVQEDSGLMEVACGCVALHKLFGDITRPLHDFRL